MKDGHVNRVNSSARPIRDVRRLQSRQIPDEAEEQDFLLPDGIV